MEMTGIGRVDFFANVDGPWLARCREEFAVELSRLAGQLLEFQAWGQEERMDDLSEREKYVLGVKDAAKWTLGVSRKAPFRPGKTAVSNAQVAETVDSAQAVSRLNPHFRPYAEGVKAWLFWLTGTDGALRYPST
jgi:hypothetical protein